jgi:hypothetical protein
LKIEKSGVLTGPPTGKVETLHANTKSLQNPDVFPFPWLNIKKGRHENLPPPQSTFTLPTNDNSLAALEF